MAPCKHDWIWRLDACNERGWECLNCKEKPGEPPGFSPQLDREFTGTKVSGLLMELHVAKLIYVSNSDMGDGMTAAVVRRCRARERFDQQTILQYLLDGDLHGDYWARISTGILAGKDPRDRCRCGKLATGAVLHGRADWLHHCSEHAPEGPDGVPF